MYILLETFNSYKISCCEAVPNDGYRTEQLLVYGEHQASRTIWLTKVSITAISLSLKNLAVVSVSNVINLLYLCEER